MSLEDIVPMLQETKIERRKPDHAGAMRRWQRKNRAHLNRYKRAWRAAGGKT